MGDNVLKGVIDCSNEQYHASEGMSRSKLWKFKQLPHKYWYEHLSGNFDRPAESEAFLLGNLVHTLVLEPHLIDERYVSIPQIDRRTKQGKIDYDEFLSSANGRSLVKPEILDMAVAMSAVITKNETAMHLLEGAVFEKSIYWTHEPTGILCKARPDVWNGHVVCDLKTTKDASYRGFQSAAYKDGYFLQAAMIYEATKSIGKPFDNFVFMCIEKEKPYSVGLYMLDEDALQFGIDMFHSLMQRFAECQRTNVWPDYGIQKLCIPKYATLETEIE